MRDRRRSDDPTVRRLLSSVSKPTVIDADALYCLHDLKLASSTVVVTPHPGEMGHLLGRSAVTGVTAMLRSPWRRCSREYQGRLRLGRSDRIRTYDPRLPKTAPAAALR